MKRRTLLRGMGLSLCLPLLESMTARTLQAAASKVATTASGAPLRLAFVYFPNGAQQKNWFPTGGERDFQLGPTMESLAGLKSHIQIIGGLDQENAEAGNDGAGDHARANATFLTGARATKTSGADIRVGQSIDQVAAEHVQGVTRFSSLELSCDAVRKSGGCDSGYSCAYQYNLSWRSPTQPMTPETNPRAMFERLFGLTAQSDAERAQRLTDSDRRSLLDFVLEDAGDLRGDLSTNDRRKLDEYLSSTRDIERRIAQAAKFPIPDQPSGIEAPAGVPTRYADHLELMFDMLALALQTDATRIATLLMAADGSNRSFPDIGIPEGHHYLTHNQNDTEMHEKVGRIDRFYMEHFARFLQRLNSLQDPDGNSILHNSMIVYGGGIGDGNRHNHDNLPIVLAGNGGGRLDAGRYHSAGGSPMTNLYLGLLERMNIGEIEAFGDSTGTYANI